MKNASEMSASQINRELDRLDTEREKINEEFIAVWRGHETAEETHRKSDPLALRWRTISDRRSELREEMERRYGPGCPSRLPRGFEPIREK